MMPCSSTKFPLSVERHNLWVIVESFINVKYCKVAIVQAGGLIFQRGDLGGDKKEIENDNGTFSPKEQEFPRGPLPRWLFLSTSKDLGRIKNLSHSTGEQSGKIIVFRSQCIQSSHCEFVRNKQV